MLLTYLQAHGPDLAGLAVLLGIFLGGIACAVIDRNGSR